MYFFTSCSCKNSSCSLRLHIYSYHVLREKKKSFLAAMENNEIDNKYSRKIYIGSKISD